MDQKTEDTQRDMQQIDTAHLFYKNLESSCKNGYISHGSGSGGVIWFVINVAHVIVTPILAIGGTAKACTDLSTRHPVSNGEVNNAVARLNQFNIWQMAHVIHTIKATPVKSDASRLLKQEIQSDLETARYQVAQKKTIEYLLDNKNAGKNLQHVIIDITNKVFFDNLNSAQYTVKTKGNLGALYLLMTLIFQKSFNNPFHLDIWFNVFHFLFNGTLNKAEIQQLGFSAGKQYIQAQLFFYDGKHQERARTFSGELSKVGSEQNLKELVFSQNEIFNDRNPYSPEERDKKFKENLESKTEDKYQEIIRLWSF